jgi:hypothetical protein
MVYLNMKKTIIIFLLLVSTTCFSQVDTTGKKIAKEQWLSNIENINKPMPIWDNEGNVLSFTLVLLLGAIYYKTNKKTKQWQ